jgi:hypothetical protein
MGFGWVTQDPQRPYLYAGCRCYAEHLCDSQADGASGCYLSRCLEMIISACWTRASVLAEVRAG